MNIFPKISGYYVKSSFWNLHRTLYEPSLIFENEDFFWNILILGKIICVAMWLLSDDGKLLKQVNLLCICPAVLFVSGLSVCLSACASVHSSARPSVRLSVRHSIEAKRTQHSTAQHSYNNHITQLSIAQYNTAQHRFLKNTHCQQVLAKVSLRKQPHFFDSFHRNSSQGRSLTK